MKTPFAVGFLFLIFSSAFAQNSGPAPQSGMEKPGMTNGARKDGSYHWHERDQGQYQARQGWCASRTHTG